MILTLALALLPVTEKVEAITEIAVGAIYFVCATIFSSMAINLVSNDNAQKKFADWFYSACDETKEAIRSAAGRLPASILNNTGAMVGSCKITFDAQSWSFICNDVREYINAYNGLDESSITPGQDGTLGWTKNSQFSVELKGGISQIALNDYTILTFRSADLKQNIFSLMPYTNNDFLNSQNSTVYSCSYTFSATPFSLIYYSAQEIVNSKFKYNGLLTSDVEKVYNSMNDLRCTHYNSEFGGTSVSILSQCIPNDKYTKMYTINGKVCYFVRCADSKYRFVTLDYLNNNPAATDDNCVPLINHYTNKTYYSFDSACEMYYTILDACKMRHLTKNADGQTTESEADDYIAYVPPFTGVAPDVYNGSSDVTLTIPDTITSVDDITGVMDADVATDYVNTADYPDGVPEIDSSGLFDKFPFCLPKDVYNLFANFYSTNAKAPKFTIPIKIGQQNDGSYFVDYDIEVDLSFLDSVVPIFRFGVSVSFVLALILITRKMIGAQ